MRAVVQRVSQASVTIDKRITGAINKGLLILIGIGEEDTSEDVEWLSSKLVSCVFKAWIFSPLANAKLSNSFFNLLISFDLMTNTCLSCLLKSSSWKKTSVK